MRPELLKLRALPTPRWTLAVTLGCAAVALVLSALVGVGEEDIAIGLGVELPTAVASIVLGSWIVGLEYGSGTMRRTLTADPRRARVVGAKIGVGLLAALALTVLCFVVFAIAFPPIADSHGADRPASEILTRLLASVPGNAIACVVGAAIALLTRSMAGGVTVALLFLLVLDTALGAVPDVGDYTLATASYDIYQAINGEGDPELGRAIPMAIAWVAAFTGAGLLRFTRSDA